MGQSGYDLTGAGYLSGLSFSIQGGDGADNQLHRSDVTPLGGAEAVLNYAPPYLAGGVAYRDAVYGMVYFSFGFEGIDNAADRAEVMERTLDFLGNCPASPSGLYTSAKQASDQLRRPGRGGYLHRDAAQHLGACHRDPHRHAARRPGICRNPHRHPGHARLCEWRDFLAGSCCTTGETAAITYTAMLNQCLAAGAEVINPAHLTDGLGAVITRTATVIVENLAPSIPQAAGPGRRDGECAGEHPAVLAGS